MALTASRRESQPWLQLLNAVLILAGERAELLRHSEKPWASVTFSGTRHLIALAFNGPSAIADGEALIEALPGYDFSIAGKLVADAAVRSVEQVSHPASLALELEILLLDEL